MSVDAYATYPHYYDHLRPIWDALEDKGTFYVGPIARRPGKVTRALGPGPPVLVAGFGDIRKTRHRQHIFMEHGVGENWGGIDPHYSGGPGRDSVILFLCPNERVAKANGRDSVVVGSPRLEVLQSIPRVASAPPRVVVSFHWDNRTFDATTSAMLAFEPNFGSWAADSRFEIAGHSHPRIAERAEKYFARAGIRYIPEFADVVAWADYYACDNSSTLFEAAACGIPIIYLDAPWFPSGDGSWRFDTYRDLAPHLSPDGDLGLIVTNYTRVSYDEMVAEVFGQVQGSALRAAEAIKRVLNDNRTESLLPGATHRADPSQPSIFDNLRG